MAQGPPKGSQYWKRRKTHGRPAIYSGEEGAARLWTEACEYFEWAEANPLIETRAMASGGGIELVEVPKMRAMTIAGLALYIDMNRSTLQQYRDRDDLRDVMERIDSVLSTQKFEGAAAGLLNANIISRDLGMIDKQEVTQKVTDSGSHEW